MNFNRNFLGFYSFAFVLPLPLPLVFSSVSMAFLIINGLILLKKERLRINLMSILFLLFFLSDFLSLYFSGRSFGENTVFNDVKIAATVLPFIIYNSRRELAKELPTILRLFVLGVVFYVIYCCFYYVYFIYTHPRYTVRIDNYLFWAIEHRFPGTFHRTYIGVYIVFSSILINLQFLRVKGMRKKVGLILLFLLLLVSILFLGSKLTLIFFLLLNTIVFLNYYKFLAIPFLFLIGFGFYFVKDRFFLTLKKSIADREAFYDKSVSIILDSPWFGIGEKNILSHQVIIENQNTTLIPHNVFLKELLSNGMIGLTIVLSIFLLFLYKAKHLNTPLLNYFLVLTLGISLIEDFIYIQRGLFFFIFFGLLLGNGFNIKILNLSKDGDRFK